MPNNSFAEATLVKDGVYISGSFNQWAKKDYYKYNAKKGKYSLLFEHKPFKGRSKGETDINIYDNNQRSFKFIRQEGFKEKEYFDFEVERDGMIYLKIDSSFDIRDLHDKRYRFGIIKSK